MRGIDVADNNARKEEKVIFYKTNDK